MARKRGTSLTAPIPAAVFGPWANPPLVLYHGTLDIDVTSIRNGINVSLGRQRTDFGRGFYTTTALRQAQEWAIRLALRYSASGRAARPAVVSFCVDRDALAGLEALWFVRAVRSANDYWSFVHYCRSLGAAHGRVVNGGWYDIVIGPVAALWREKRSIRDSDQISFHTNKSEQLLNSRIGDAIVLRQGKWRKSP